MARAVRHSSQPIWFRRIRNTLRTIFARGDLATLVITCALMIIPVLALVNSLNFATDFTTQSGEWPVSLGQLVPIAALSVIFGFLLARSHYSELTALILSTIYSFGTILLIQFFAAPGDPLRRVYNILSRFMTALNLGAESGLDPYLLVMFLSVLVWFLGHNTAWHTFRIDRVWRAILPPGIVLALNNIYNMAEGASLDWYIILYAFLSLLLIIRSHIEAREFDWYMNRIAFRSNVRSWFFRFGGALAALLLCFAWLLPTGSAAENARRFQEFLNEDAVTRIMELLNRLFGSIESNSVATADYYGGDKLVLSGAIQLGDQIVMAVQATPGPRYYWKSRIFDTFTNGEWTAARSSSVESQTGGLVLTYPPVEARARRDVTQTYTMVIGASRLVYAAPQPVSLRLPVKVDVDYVARGTGAVDPASYRAVRTLARGDRYTVVSSVSAASADFLRGTSTDYPDWVRAKNLQLPPNITTRTRELAARVVAVSNAQTAYDKAKAIEVWLRQNIAYREGIESPPPGKELIDWVLFEKREAYCTYYASAMIVMLRSLGIPARMAAGFAQGIYDPAAQAYIVRERDAHTWVEVYFPGAGWVEFEPTSAQSAIERVDARALPPTPTFTPTFTATPLVEVSIPTPQVAPPNPNPSAAPLVTYTPTPSPLIPTPTPSPTAIAPPPLSFLDLPPPVQDFLSGLLVVALAIAGLSFAGVTYLWWVDYRGLDRLGPIGRAYARLAIYASWLGLGFRQGSTPLERGKRVAREVPEEGRTVIKITDAYIGERYGPPRPSTAEEEKQAEAAWKRVRRAAIRKRIRRFFKRG